MDGCFKKSAVITCHHKGGKGTVKPHKSKEEMGDWGR